MRESDREHEREWGKKGERTNGMQGKRKKADYKVNINWASLKQKKQKQNRFAVKLLLARV